MFRTIHHMLGYTVNATDGKAGHIDDFYFDERNWLVTYLVVDTGNLLPGRKVLVSPNHIERIDDDVQSLTIALDLGAIEHSPDVNSDPPIDRMAEDLHDSQVDSLPVSRLGGGLFQEQTISMDPDSMVEMMRAEERQREAEIIEQRPSHLRSAKDVIGSYLHASDGDMGHIEDLVVDEKMWAIHQVIIDTRNWLPGKKVQLEARWIESIDWAENTVYVSISKHAIENKPEYHQNNPVEYPAKTLS